MVWTSTTTIVPFRLVGYWLCSYYCREVESFGRVLLFEKMNFRLYTLQLAYFHTLSLKNHAQGKSYQLIPQINQSPSLQSSFPFPLEATHPPSSSQANKSNSPEPPPQSSLQPISSLELFSNFQHLPSRVPPRGPLVHHSTCLHQI